MKIVRLSCEGLSDPAGIDAPAPRLSWQIESAARGVRQQAYQVIVDSSLAGLAAERGDFWNTGKVESDASVNVPYGGSALQSGKVYYWKVRAWNSEGKPTAWSEPSHWSMGLLTKEDWKGTWIGLDEIDTTYHLTEASWIWYPEANPEISAPVGTRCFRRRVELPESPRLVTARLHITGDNVCTAYINGIEVGRSDNPSLVPNINVREFLRPGQNVCAAVVTNTGSGPNPAGLVGVLELTFVDGTVTRIATDASWRACDREYPAWKFAAYNDGSWVHAKVLGPAGMQPWGEVSGPGDRRLPARWLRKEFDAGKKVVRATAYTCGLGLSELYVNGAKAGDDVLSPALSQYPKRAYYVTHDVTPLIRRGRNALGVVLGNGRFFAPRLDDPTFTQSFGYPKLLFQLNIEFDDGSSQEVASDDSWKLTTAGPIRANNEYDGEEYDARMELRGWAEPGYEDGSWSRANIVAPPGGEIRAQMIEPIRVTGTLKPVSVNQLKPGVFIVDMGQNMVGWCRIHVRGERGTQVRLRHAETLKPDGSLYLDNLRSAKATDVYTLRGGGPETYEPRFTYHGFRFVEVTGFPGRPRPGTIEGRVVNDDVRTAGEFTCSHPLINRIYKNIVWGVRGNYRSIPTDCPQRDERQGWLGDRSEESRGETYLFKVNALYEKWLQDMEDAQRDDGSVSDVCPSYWPLYNDNVTWPSSTVIIPDALYDQYGDARIIRRHYPSMVKWIDHMSQYITGGIISKDNYGDWCVPPENPKLIHTSDPMRKTTAGILGTSYFYHDLRLMSRYAAMLGKNADVKRFDDTAAQLMKGLNRTFYNEKGGYYDNGSQTSCVLPLAFGMVPASGRGRVFGHLVHKITDETYGHIGTGLVGGQWLNRVLSDNGRPDIVYRFVTDTIYPGWGYMVSRGATTIWELWNGDRADPAMNSGNHVMLVGDLVIWLYEDLAGIRPDPDRPGFAHILMRPTPVENLRHVRATHESPYGLIVSEWEHGKKGFDWNIVVPANSTATVSVPARKAENVTEGGRAARGAQGVKFLRQEEGYAVFEVGSGRYRFHAPAR